ncbi:mandelate racemase/muconate lactonizing enzyme family protein [Frigidibacter sp. ROC022]|uniref:mandelate racemase/muconate lactonizing enzyme family protein n=1 Tax=Frigidibacter sp. ROC022 TaxID=2971796 RepID=UPI00215A527A|nr:mandelate racemase/muconate lactonizing enzyme family protein [Frigidibacter sp. ROC022]MCR8725382.1 mandelate racemase/muconate lactonizing enzyme family protein [Frigidibacter sp. ROC022]
MSSLTIEDVVCVPLVGESPKGGWSNEIQPDDSIHALIAVHTAGGASGYGSCFTDGYLAKEAVRQLRPLLIGENAAEVGRLTETLHQNSFWMGRGGTLTHAISGINIALWDLLGKAVGLPVSVLLGGRYKERIEPYASLLMDEPEKMGDVLSGYVEQGYRAFKIGWGPFGRSGSYARDEAIIRAARDVLCHGEHLMVDAGGSDAFWPNRLKWAMRTADMLVDYEVDWFEEALQPDDLEGFVALRNYSRVPISGAEVLTRWQSFRPFIEAGAFDIIQPDVTKVGGITEQRRIVEMAEQHGVAYVGHGWNTALGLAADLQMAAAFANTPFVEYIGGSRYVDGILETPFTLDADGFLDIPAAPGLGVTLDSGRLDGIAVGLEALRL